MVKKFFSAASIWSKLAGSDPFLIATAVLAMLLSWGWVLVDVDLFHLLWYDNAGAWYDNNGNSKQYNQLWIHGGKLLGSGIAAGIFWCIWITTAYSCFRKSVEMRKSEGVHFFPQWFGFPCLPSCHLFHFSIRMLRNIRIA